MRRTKTSWAMVLGASTAALCAACGEAPAIDVGERWDRDDELGNHGPESGHELGTAESALTTAPPTYVDCSNVAPAGGDSDLTIVKNARNIVVNRLYNSTSQQQFVACMRNGIWSATSAYPEQLHRLLQENIPTRLWCRADRESAGHTLAPEDGSPAALEEIWFAPGNFARGRDVEQNNGIPAENVIAELLIHELVHTKGFYLPSGRGSGHPGPEALGPNESHCPGASCIERQMAATNIVTSCLFDDRAMDWNPPDAPPNSIPIRTEMATSTGEVTLAPVGNIRDTEPADENYCGTNQVGVGIRGRYDNYVTALGMACREGAGAVHLNGRTGASTGTTFSYTCPADEVLIGLRGRAGWWQNNVQPVCALKSSVQAGLRTTNVSPPSWGGSGGDGYERLCPPYQIVKGLRLRYTEVITRMDVQCQRYDKPSDIRTTLLPTLGNAGGDASDDEHCPSKSVMDKLWGVVRQDGFFEPLLKLGAGCSKVENTGPGQPITVRSGAGNVNHMLPFRGQRLINEAQGWPVPATPDDPPESGLGLARECQGTNSVLVGLKAQWHAPSGSIVGVHGVCATDANGWSKGADPGAVTTTTTTAVLGEVGTTEQVQICPVGQFLTGWRISEEPQVMNIRPRCRRF